MKSLFLIIILFFTVHSQQKIDFRYSDPKGLSQSELKEYQKSRDDFFRKFNKTSGLRSEIRSLVIQGNKVKTIIYNTGSISRPGALGNVLDLVWNGLGYGYEFGPLVATKVLKANTLIDSIKIVTEGFDNPSDGEYGTDGTKWGWLPKSGYSAPNQPDVASWGARSKVNNDLRMRPPSWPESWFNSGLNQYVYPSFLGGNSTVPDEEVYYVVDDFTKKEFQYYPFPDDSSKRGLGINLEVRTFQFSNPLAEDIIFLVYTVENESPKTLPRVYFGMFGDPHVGGPYNYSDDAASFIPSKEGTVFKDGQDLTIVNGTLTAQRARNLVYAWDPDKKGDISNIAPGYFGYKFLESPNNSTDNIDNDDDGIIDENPFGDKGTFIDGITKNIWTGISDSTKFKNVYGKPKARWSGDEDSDWDISRDDVGVDGILNPNAPDFGEGNGMPDQLIENGIWKGSEPNFGFRDVNESDQIGLKSFWALEFGGQNRPKNDILMYDKITSDTSDVSLLYPPTTGDNIFLYGSGPFNLNRGDRQRFSIALLFGSDLNDLLLNSEIAQRVLEANYRFAQPPPKPKVTAVAGNNRVTLYWDRESETSVDPLTNKNDFEGYKIYRSRDYTFSDVYQITDGRGFPFIGKALYDETSQKLAQWHRPWTDAEKALYLNGYHPAEYIGRSVKYYMGDPNDNTGLAHQFVDSNVTNGVTYYYAVVSFDHGVYNDSLKLPPTESQAIIQRDAVTQEFRFDVNTAAVIPNNNAVGIISLKDDLQAGKTLLHTKGNSTSSVSLKVLNQNTLDESKYSLSFKKIKVANDSVLSYTVLRDTPIEEVVEGRDTLFVNLAKINILKNSVTVFNQKTNLEIPISNFIIDSAGGLIRAKEFGIFKRGEFYKIFYKYVPVLNSTYLKNEDSNPVFEGLRIFVKDDLLAIDNTNSKFNVTTTNVKTAVVTPSIGTPKFAPLDVKIVFNKIDTANGKYLFPGDTINPSSGSIKVQTPFYILNATDTTKLSAIIVDVANKGVWDWGEKIVILTPPPYKVSNTNTMMEINFTLSSVATNKPTFLGGEYFTARMKKPLTITDNYEFTSKKNYFDAQLGNADLQNVYTVPNPYVVTSQFELPGNRPGIRGERALQFRNLPLECTIRIYTITGELVRVINKSDNTNFATWDLLSDESARVGYGVYIYQVETPTGGKKIGRIGVIK